MKIEIRTRIAASSCHTPLMIIVDRAAHGLYALLKLCRIIGKVRRKNSEATCCIASSKMKEIQNLIYRSKVVGDISYDMCKGKNS